MFEIQEKTNLLFCRWVIYMYIFLILNCDRIFFFISRKKCEIDLFFFFFVCIHRRWDELTNWRCNRLWRYIYRCLTEVFFFVFFRLSFWMCNQVYVFTQIRLINFVHFVVMCKYAVYSDFFFAATQSRRCMNYTHWK